MPGRPARSALTSAPGSISGGAAGVDQQRGRLHARQVGGGDDAARRLHEAQVQGDDVAFLEERARLLGGSVVRPRGRGPASFARPHQHVHAEGLAVARHDAPIRP